MLRGVNVSICFTVGGNVVLGSGCVYLFLIVMGVDMGCIP
jgi:hypothetical protein